MNLLITGGTGFLGKNLINSLANKANLLVITRKNKKSTSSKLKYLKSSFKINKKIFLKIKDFNPKVVIHLGWENIPDYSFVRSKKNFFSSKNVFLE